MLLFVPHLSSIPVYISYPKTVVNPSKNYGLVFVVNSHPNCWNFHSTEKGSFLHYNIIRCNLYHSTLFRQKFPPPGSHSERLTSLFRELLKGADSSSSQFDNIQSIREKGVLARVLFCSRVRWLSHIRRTEGARAACPNQVDDPSAA